MKNNTNYYLKYLKYKNKYLALKQKYLNLFDGQEYQQPSVDNMLTSTKHKYLNLFDGIEYPDENNYSQDVNINQTGGYYLFSLIESLEILIRGIYLENLYNDEKFQGTTLNNIINNTYHYRDMIKKTLDCIIEINRQIVIIYNQSMLDKKKRRGKPEKYTDDDILALSKIDRAFLYICKILYVLDNNPREIIRRLNEKRTELRINIGETISENDDKLLNTIKRDLVSILSGLAKIYVDIKTTPYNSNVPIQIMINEYNFNVEINKNPYLYPSIAENNNKL